MISGSNNSVSISFTNSGTLDWVSTGPNAVRLALGTPDTTSATAGANAFYYISSTTRQTAFLKPEEIDRQVVAIYFNKVGSVEKVSNYGLKDGKIVDFNGNETLGAMRDKNLISRFFRGVGPKTKIADEQ